MKYLTLAVASDAEADRLIEDLLQHPNEPLRSPHWGNAVHARLLPTPDDERAGARPEAAV
jgi:hypothetical protein